MIATMVESIFFMSFHVELDHRRGGRRCRGEPEPRRRTRRDAGDVECGRRVGRRSGIADFLVCEHERAGSIRCARFVEGGTHHDVVSEGVSCSVEVLAIHRCHGIGARSVQEERDKVRRGRRSQVPDGERRGRGLIEVPRSVHDVSLMGRRRRHGECRRHVDRTRE